MRRHSSRLFTILATMMVGLLVTACTTTGSAETSASSSATENSAFPVTIAHALGTTKISKQPTRIATLGWADGDVALSLGVVPVGAPKVTWGGNAAASTPWFDAKLKQLGGKAPTRYSDADGAPVDEVAKLAPDLILATQSGLTKDEYTKLSKIAPVVAYPKIAWGTSWQESLDLVARAVGKTEEAAKVKQETEGSITATAAKFPALKGKSFIFASLSTADKSKIDYYTTTDNRVRLLTELGMRPAPIVEQNSKGTEFFKSVSAEKANTLTADVFVTYTMQKGELANLKNDPLISQIPALKSGAFVDASNQTDVAGMSSPSPLAIPYAMEHFVPLVGAAAGKTG